MCGLPATKIGCFVEPKKPNKGDKLYLRCNYELSP
ncbi:hypothetical protein V3C99_014248 [Haemonchus contortus]